MTDEVVFWFTVLFALLFLALSFYGLYRCKQNTRKCIRDLLELGVIVEYKHRHLYRSKSGDNYIILDFNVDLPPFDEEEFDDIEKAITRFVEATDLE